ncbi:hypothetical protein PRIPAC_96278 [Pristionchus pacificus]|uniref:Uncharacterized protein n=1 Tax=Pristionchus pacificus TaxID=54126 RepID=A0A8R1V520_PRIPA|nr:hypothetical protein PRIPAC_96278 [Pristionchus pacificus]
MDEINLRFDEPPVRLIALQIYQESFMKKKWRHVAGALIESSKHGRARLEIYNNEEGLTAKKTSNVIILDDCLSIRVVDLQDESSRHLKLQLRNGNTVSLKADNVFALRAQLSRLAFPSQFFTLNRPFSLDSPTTPPDIIPAEFSLSSPALLLQTVGGIQEGSYDIAFNDEKLELRKDNNIAASFDYEQIFWIASGDYCFGFETNQTLLYEFKCTQPQQIIDNYRKKCKFRAHFHPTSRTTINHYLRFYYPDILRSGDSTLSSESKNFLSSSSTVSSQPMLPESSQGSSEYEEISAHQIRNVRFAPVVTSEINPKGSNKIVGFFKNISPFNKTPKERSTFEQRANYEFRHAAVKKKGKAQPQKLATIIRYNPDARISRVGTSPQPEPAQNISTGPEVNTEASGSGEEPLYSPIPLAIANSPLDSSIISLVSHLAPATRASLASATPTADASRVSRVEILQSTYID